MNRLDKQVRITMRSMPSLHQLAQELATIRAAGFCLAGRMERFTARMIATADRHQMNVSDAYDRVSSLAYAIQADDAKAAQSDLALDARRKAV